MTRPSNQSALSAEPLKNKQKKQKKQKKPQNKKQKTITLSMTETNIQDIK